MLLRFFEHADAVIAVCARQCRGSRCFLRALAATHAGASARAVKHPRTSAGCRVRRAARCASLCEAVLCGSLLHLLQAPGCERRATSYAVLACHDRTRQRVSLSQVRARLREHRVAIEHAARAHRVEHLSGRRTRTCGGGGLAGSNSRAPSFGHGWRGLCSWPPAPRTLEAAGGAPSCCSPLRRRHLEALQRPSRAGQRCRWAPVTCAPSPHPRGRARHRAAVPTPTT